jgi:hypothetical protein
MDPIDLERDRSLKFVQVVFAILALASLAASLLVITHGDEFGLPETSIFSVALAFLIVGIMDTALLFAWETLFKRIQL